VKLSANILRRISRGSDSKGEAAPNGAKTQL
jgi:hypothetical protein